MEGEEEKQIREERRERKRRERKGREDYLRMYPK